ncbi:hypothetical protein CNMCM5623_003654 [Aspergillus felis]|uniref:AB hydrolase-1 domain-containing protein n=1 Tax=Aspergillus felis TaxID=1287682 RepID=A0A8H6QMT4_9EURO|nr:hypothetical protein CNMCM5623_003654 [Aspergillus felis]KAF7174681.1 hypothetical protein CNMCM7691_003367 [Aspergillus felis]
MVLTTVGFLTAIGVDKADIIGFSMGGLIAQYIAVDHPHFVNKLVLAGTQSGYGDGVAYAPPEVLESLSVPGQPLEEDIVPLFFTPSETSRALGHQWFERIRERQVTGEERKGFLEGPGITAQHTAIWKFASDPEIFDRLGTITMPVLVTNGHNDIMAPTVNSYILQQKLPKAELHIYADSGHGHLFQMAETYAKQLELFLGP